MSTLVFINMQFTSLDSNCSPVSIGLVDMDGNSFYAEFETYDPMLMDPWAMQNLPSALIVANPSMTINADEVVIGDKDAVVMGLTRWFERYTSVELWGDAKDYAIVGFDELFGGWHNRPTNINHTSYDITTYMRVKGVDPDISREEFVGETINGLRNNALYNARLIKAAYEKLLDMDRDKDEDSELNNQSDMSNADIMSAQ